MQTIKFVKKPSIGPTLACEVHHVTNVFSYIIKGFYHPNAYILGRLVEDSHVGALICLLFSMVDMSIVLFFYELPQASHKFIPKNHIKMLSLFIKLVES